MANGDLGVTSGGRGMRVSAVAPTTASYFDGLKLNRRHYLMFFLILLGTFFDQMDLYNMSFVGPAVIQNWGMTMGQLAAVNSAMVFTMLFGGLFGGYFADRRGRKTSLLTGVLIFSIFSMGNGLAVNYEMFLVTRCLTGFGIAMLVCTEMTFMTEITPSEVRGRWVAITFGCSLVASPLTAAIARIVIPMADWGWRLVFGVGGLGIIIFILGCFWLVESPRWLVSKGRYDEAKKVFKELTKLDLVINPEDTVPVKKPSWAETARCMLSKNYRRPSVVLSIFMYFIGCAAAFMFITWTPTFLTQHGFDLQTSLNISFIISIGMPLGGVLAAFISDKMGRKVPLGGTMIAYGLLAFVFGRMTDTTVLMGVGLCMAMCHMAYFSMTGPYAAENYPTYIRGTSYSFIYTFSRLGPTIGNAYAPAIFAAAGFVGYYSIVCGLLVFAGAMVVIFGRSTAGHNLEDMHKEWTDKIALEQLERRPNDDLQRSQAV